MAVASSALVGAKPANAVPDWAVNGGAATAGAAAAAAFVGRHRSASVPVLTPIVPPEIVAVEETEVNPVEVDEEVPAEVAPAEADVSALVLAGVLLRETPGWQKALAMAVPSAAILGLVLAARRWSHRELVKLKEQNLSGETANKLQEALLLVELKLAAIVEERDLAKTDFETWKTTLEAEVVTNNELAQHKLDAAFAETKTVRDELAVATKKLEEYGLTKEELAQATRMNQELQKQLNAVQEANMRELEALHQDLDKARLGSKKELEAALNETLGLRVELKSAYEQSEEYKAKFEALERSRDMAGAEAAALTFEAEAKLLEAITEREALYAWRTEREAWEITTKANFLQMETEMKEAKTRLKSAEFGSNEAFELSVSLGETQGKSCISQIPRLFDHTILTLFFKTQGALDAARLETVAAAAATTLAENALVESIGKYDTLKQEYETLKEEYDESKEDAAGSSADFANLEKALRGALADAKELRSALAAAEKAIGDSRATIATLSERSSADTTEKLAELKKQHGAQIWEMETNMRLLEETMSRTKQIASTNAARMMRHNERMGRVVSGGLGTDDNQGSAIPVKFEIVVETVPGQRVAMVGTWNDWDVDASFPMRWTEGNLWTVTTPIHADDTYEYKYVIIDEGAATCEWQRGNNRTLALQLSLHDDVVLVEVVDSWTPNPSAMPIMLHCNDGTVREVGSTALLRECVRELRTEQALLDGSANLMMLQEISASLSGMALPAPGQRAGGDAIGVGGSAPTPPKKGGGIRNNTVEKTSLGPAGSTFPTHATPAALREAAAARSAKLVAKNGPAPPAKPVETPAPASAAPPTPLPAVPTMARSDERDNVAVEDLEIHEDRKVAKRDAGVEAETGPR